MVLCSLGAPIARAEEPPPRDPLELRLDASGLTDQQLTATSRDAQRILDAELTVTSEPEGLGLLATRMLENGRGVERRICHAPCTAYLEHGSYHFVVETRRGRDRQVPSSYAIYNDGTLELSIVSRFWVRFGWYSFSAGLVGGGLSLYLTNRTPHRSDDPFCYTNCVSFTTGQRTAMTIGGLMTMFGGITVRVAIANRDTGRVHYQVSRRNRHIEPSG